MAILVPLLLVLIFIWLVILSFLLYKTKQHYYHLVSKTGKEHLDDILEQLISKDEHFIKDLSQIKEKVAFLEGHAYQKIGFLRFNPFEHVAGDQSFILSLLDGDNTGVLLNFLYTRDGVRVYSKRVKKGLSEEYELSSEEKEVIKKAQ